MSRRARKLKPEQVRFIREWQAEECPHCGSRSTEADLARAFGVNRGIISHVRRGLTYKDIA